MPSASTSTSASTSSASNHALRRLKRKRALEDVLGIAITSITFGLTMKGMMLGSSYDVYFWMQIMPMMMELILIGVALCYFISSLCVTLFKPQSRFTSLFSDLFWLVPALVVGIGFAAFYSWTVARYPNCGQARSYSYSYWPEWNSMCPFTEAGLGFSWVFVVFILGLLLVRVLRYTRVHAPIKMSLVERAQLERRPDIELSPKAQEAQEE